MGAGAGGLPPRGLTAMAAGMTSPSWWCRPARPGRARVPDGGLARPWLSSLRTTTSEETPMLDAIKAAAPGGGQFLTFDVGGQQFGLEILKVREIIGVQQITPVPGSPATLLGVINLRGSVIPVLSLRRRFAMAEAESHPHNVIIVVDGIDHAAIGLSVDRVREVCTFAAGEIEPPPGYGLRIDTSMIKAIGKSQGQIRILLDIDKLLAAHGDVPLEPA
jgi:purine-binding chemotaxis protein CheW